MKVQSVLYPKCQVNMAIPSLNKFFKKVEVLDHDRERNFSGKALPDSEGQLSSKVPLSFIMSANNAVMNAPGTTKKRIRGAYDRFTPEEKAIIA